MVKRRQIKDLTLDTTLVTSKHLKNISKNTKFDFKFQILKK